MKVNKSMYFFFFFQKATHFMNVVISNFLKDSEPVKGQMIQHWNPTRVVGYMIHFFSHYFSQTHICVIYTTQTSQRLLLMSTYSSSYSTQCQIEAFSFASTKKKKNLFICLCFMCVYHYLHLG